MRALVLIAILAACDSDAHKPVTPATPGSDVPATGSTAEKFDAAVAKTGGPRTPPRVEASCQSDGDCVIEGDELVDQAPKTYACCPGCSQNAVNATSYKAFQGWCEQSPAPQCPPIGCVQPILHAECEAGHCVAKPGEKKVVATPRTPPKVDASCQRDTDCVLDSDELVDNAPKTYACCPGCSQNAVNATSYKAFQGWCEQSPAPQCPPLGCKMAIMHPECEAGHCVAKLGAPKAGRTPPKVSNSCDGGCTLTDLDLDGDHACCPGCGQSAVNANSYKAFQAWCSTNPASQCPALGCAMQPMRAECEAGHCTAKSMRDIPKPP